MQRTLSAPRSTVTQPGTGTGVQNISESIEDVWKDRAHKLAKLVYDLEVQKLELQKRLEVAEALRASHPEAADVLALHEELLALQTKLRAREESLKERETMVKVAAGKARAEVLSMQSALAHRQSVQQRSDTFDSEFTKVNPKTEKDSDLISAVQNPLVKASQPDEKRKSTHSQMNHHYYYSPGKTAHVDVATMQSMLRQKEKELAVLREDNAAKEKELLHALQLLQAAHKREGELRCQASNLSNQLELMRHALQQSNGDIDSLEQELKDLESAKHRDVDEISNNNESIRAQLDGFALALEETKKEAALYACRATCLQSELDEAQLKVIELEENLALVQQYVMLDAEDSSTIRKDATRGRRAAIGMASAVMIARIAVEGLVKLAQLAG